MPSDYKSPMTIHPPQDFGALPKRWRRVEDATVIEVVNATHRNCPAVAGFFEMVNPERDPCKRRGKLKAEVYCAWHDQKPAFTFMDLIIGEGAQVHYHYTGEVIDNLA